MKHTFSSRSLRTAHFAAMVQHARRWASRALLSSLALSLPACMQFCPALPRVTQSTAPAIVRAVAEEVETLPPVEAGPKPLPISLDTVLRMAEEQSGQIGIARARVDEAFAEKDLADAGWLPKVYVGTAYYRHEGGIQDPDGRFIHSSFGSLFGGLELNSRYDIREITFQKVNAERKLWQQKGDLSRVTSETLLEASQTYIDLLAARTGQAIAHGMQADMESLLARTEKLAAKEPSARVEVARIQAEITGRKQTIRKLQAQAASTSAKLAYLLGIDPLTELVPVDERLVPLSIIDANLPVNQLVAQALANGPAIREMESLLGVIHEAIAKANSKSAYLPILETRMAEGIFGAGPGASSTWDNRWDLGLQARWNVTEFLTAKERRRIAEAKMQQANLAYQDLRAKLTAGVQDSRETILGEAEQIELGSTQIEYARKAYQMSLDRLRDVKEATATEVMLSLQGVALARLNYLNSVRAYDRAQLQLMILLGPSAANCLPKVAAQQLPNVEGTGK